MKRFEVLLTDPKNPIQAALTEILARSERLEQLLQEAKDLQVQLVRDQLGPERTFEDELETASRHIRELTAYEALSFEDRQRQDAQRSWACYSDLPHAAIYEAFRALRRQPAEDDIFAQEYKRCVLAWLDAHPEADSIRALLAKLGGESNGA